MYTFVKSPKFGSPYQFSINICDWIIQNLSSQEHDLNNIVPDNFQSVIDMSLPVEDRYLPDFKQRTINMFGENWKEEFEDQIDECIKYILRRNSADSIILTRKLQNMGFDMSPYMRPYMPPFKGGYKKKKKKKSTNKKNNIKKVKKRKTKKKYTKKRKA
jgi:hypothetical protein